MSSRNDLAFLRDWLQRKAPACYLLADRGGEMYFCNSGGSLKPRGSANDLSALHPDLRCFRYGPSSIGTGPTCHFERSPLSMEQIIRHKEILS
jgi:hypothetical protein